MLWVLRAAWVAARPSGSRRDVGRAVPAAAMSVAAVLVGPVPAAPAAGAGPLPWRER
jgi:hypothetical protein